MRKMFLAALMMCLSLGAQAQSGTLNPDRLSMVMSQVELRPQRDALILTPRIFGALAASPNPANYRAALAWADRHMGDPTDSLYNEELYLAILQQAVDDSTLTASEKERPRLMIDALSKNRVGTVAATIDYVLPDGSRHTTAELAGRHVLLLFNDPECESCALVKQRIAASDTIARLVDKGQLTVLAVYSGDNERAWRGASCPAPITNGWNKSMSVVDKDLYYLPSQPLMYLLAPDGTVLVKNEPSLRRLLTHPLFATPTAEQ